MPNPITLDSILSGTANIQLQNIDDSNNNHNVIFLKRCVTKCDLSENKEVQPRANEKYVEINNFLKYQKTIYERKTEVKFKEDICHMFISFVKIVLMCAKNEINRETFNNSLKTLNIVDNVFKVGSFSYHLVRSKGIGNQVPKINSIYEEENDQELDFVIPTITNYLKNFQEKEIKQNVATSSSFVLSNKDFILSTLKWLIKNESSQVQVSDTQALNDAVNELENINDNQSNVEDDIIIEIIKIGVHVSHFLYVLVQDNKRGEEFNKILGNSLFNIHITQSNQNDKETDPSVVQKLETICDKKNIQECVEKSGSDPNGSEQSMDIAKVICQFMDVYPEAALYVLCKRYIRERSLAEVAKNDDNNNPTINNTPAANVLKVLLRLEDEKATETQSNDSDPNSFDEKTSCEVVNTIPAETQLNDPNSFLNQLYNAQDEDAFCKVVDTIAGETYLSY